MRTCPLWSHFICGGLPNELHNEKSLTVQHIENGAMILCNGPPIPRARETGPARYLEPAQIRIPRCSMSFMLILWIVWAGVRRLSSYSWRIAVRSPVMKKTRSFLTIDADHHKKEQQTEILAKVNRIQPYRTHCHWRDVRTWRLYSRHIRLGCSSPDDVERTQAPQRFREARAYDPFAFYRIPSIWPLATTSISTSLPARSRRAARVLHPPAT